jgi:hypothetical protein
MSKITYNGKRIVLGIGLLFWFLCVANYYLNLGMSGRFGKHVVILVFVVLLLFQHYIGPSFTEVREHRDNKRHAAKRRT